MMLPLNQDCDSFGTGSGGMFMDGCGDHGISSDVAELAAIALMACGVAAATYTGRSAFAAVLLAASAFRAVWGIPMPRTPGAGAVLYSRAAVAWHTSLLVWLHLVFRSGGGCVCTGTTALVAYVYIMVAWGLSVTSVALSPTSTPQPTELYFAFDCVGAGLASYWLLKPGVKP